MISLYRRQNLDWNSYIIVNKRYLTNDSDDEVSNKCHLIISQLIYSILQFKITVVVDKKI